MTTTQMLSSKLIADFSSQQNEPSWLAGKRISAFEKALSLPFPSMKYGVTMQMNPPELSVEQMNPFAQTIQPDNEFSESAKAKLFSLFPQDDKFSLLHQSFASVRVIHLEKGKVYSHPILVQSFASSDFGEHLLVIAEPESSATIIHDVSSSNNAKFVSFGVELFLSKYSKIKFVNIQHLSLQDFHIDLRRAELEESACLEWADVCLGSGFVHSSCSTTLSGRRAESRLNSVFFGSGKQQFNTFWRMVHSAPETVSDMLTKGVLDNQAKTIYRGEIHIKRNAPQSNGYQKEDSLLLSGEAESDAVPKLEIDNNDVKCSHGATVSQVDKEKLFYMQSRGLSVGEAKKHIVQGFFEGVLSQLSQELQQSLREKIEERTSAIK